MLKEQTKLRDKLKSAWVNLIKEDNEYRRENRDEVDRITAILKRNAWIHLQLNAVASAIDECEPDEIANYLLDIEEMKEEAQNDEEENYDRT